MLSRWHMFLLLWLLPVNAVLAGSAVAILEPVQDGETIVSDFFSVESTKSFFRPRKIRVFHTSGNIRELLGISNFSDFSSRQNGYAISNDGRTLLYFHQNKRGREGVDKPSGLYEYTEGKGDILVHLGVNNGAYIKQKTPANTIVFRRLERIPDSYGVTGKVFLRDTSGNERLWETR